MNHKFRKITRKCLQGAAMIALISGVSLSASQSVNAAGFYIQEQSVSGLGTSFAGQAASPRDASILFFNPSGLTHLDGRQVNVGVHLISPHAKLEDNGSTITDPAVNGGAAQALNLVAGIGTLDDGGNPGSVAAVPNFYYAQPFTDDNKWWLGFGISAPFGLGTEYNDDFFGRFLSTKSKLQTIDFQPTIAYQATDWLSIGASAIIEKATANLFQNAYVATAVGGPRQIKTNLKGEDWSLGYNVGFMIEPWDHTTIGLDYRSGISHTLVGELVVEDGTFASSGAEANLTLPDIASLGMAHRFNDQWTGLLSATWFGWNNTDKVRVRRDDGAAGPTLAFDYHATWAFGLGAEYKWDDEWTFRAGYQWDETPSSLRGRSSLNPDGDRNWFSGGLTYNYSDKISVDFAATYIDIEDTDIDQTRTGVGGVGSANIVAKANDTYALIGALGINVKF